MGLVDRVDLAVRVRDRERVLEWVLEWLRALADRCIRRERFREDRVVDRVDRASLRDLALVAVQGDPGLGIGQELLRVG